MNEIKVGMAKRTIERVNYDKVKIWIKKTMAKSQNYEKSVMA